MHRVEVEVLGPLVVRVDGTPVALPGPKQRCLVAALALAQGRAVSVGALIDAVWGDDAPDGADHTLQQHVSAVRKLLGGAGGAGGRLVTRSPGYLLEVEALDAAAFETDAAVAVARAASGDAAGAAAGWAEALGRWRGPALADASATPPLAAAALRLEGLHLAALEGSFDARLACGEAAGLVPAIEAIVACHPFHERFRAQLMLALYRSGRQSDALAAYRQAREVLVDELGIEPGVQLRDLEQAILLQSEGLDLTAAAGPPVVASAPPDSPDPGVDQVFETYRADAGASAGRIELPDGQGVQLRDGRAVIGRDPAAVIRLVDNRVSRQHACIDTLSGSSSIRDLGSTNGTTVNGQAITSHLLADGDEVSVGGVPLRFRAGPSA